MVYCNCCLVTEGEYAYSKKRDIIPLIVEQDYEADGWLGPLVLNRLYFDFTQETSFGDMMAKLVKEIGCRGKLCQKKCKCDGELRCAASRQLTDNWNLVIVNTPLLSSGLRNTVNFGEFPSPREVRGFRVRTNPRTHIFEGICNCKIFQKSSLKSPADCAYIIYSPNVHSAFKS